MNAGFLRITPFLWFNDQAEEAVNFYASIFDNSRILATSRYTSESAQASSRTEGSVMTVAFQLDGQDFTAEWRTHLQIHRSTFAGRQLPVAGRSGSLLASSLTGG